MNKWNVKSLQVVVTIQGPMGIDQIVFISAFVFLELFQWQKAHFSVHRIQYGLKVQIFGQTRKKPRSPLKKRKACEIIGFPREIQGLFKLGHVLKISLQIESPAVIGAGDLSGLSRIVAKNIPTVGADVGYTG